MVLVTNVTKCNIQSRRDHPDDGDPTKRLCISSAVRVFCMPVMPQFIHNANLKNANLFPGYLFALRSKKKEALKFISVQQIY